MGKIKSYDKLKLDKESLFGELHPIPKQFLNDMLFPIPKGRAFTGHWRYINDNSKNILYLKNKYASKTTTLLYPVCRYLSKNVEINLRNMNLKANKTFVVGGPGTGKTLSYILPQLDNADGNKENLIILDSDGDIYNLKEILLQKGYDLIIYDTRKHQVFEDSEHSKHYVYSPLDHIKTEEDIEILSNKLIEIIDYNQKNNRAKYQDKIFVKDLLKCCWTSKDENEINNFMKKVNSAFLPIYKMVKPIINQYLENNNISNLEEINLDFLKKEKKAIFIIPDAWSNPFENNKIFVTLLLSYICDEIKEADNGDLFRYHFLYNGTNEINNMDLLSGIEQDFLKLDNREDISFSFCMSSLQNMNYYLEYAFATTDILIYMGHLKDEDKIKIFPFLHNKEFEVIESIDCIDDDDCIIRIKGEIPVRDGKYAIGL